MGFLLITKGEFNATHRGSPHEHNIQYFLMQYWDAIHICNSKKQLNSLQKYQKQHTITRGRSKLGRDIISYKNFSSLFWFPKENTFCDFCDTLKHNVLVSRSKVYLLQCRNICCGFKKYLKYCVTILHNNY